MTLCDKKEDSVDCGQRKRLVNDEVDGGVWIDMVL